MPYPVLSVAETRAIEAEADRSGITYDEMMQRAGRALAERLAALLVESGAPRDQWRACFLVGPGNNGGDGLVAGLRLAADTGAQVRFYLLKDRPEGDTHLQAVQAAGLLVANAADDQRFRVLTQMVTTSLVVVDALFGIGARLPLNADTRKLLAAVKRAFAESPIHDLAATFADSPPTVSHHHARVLAVDCPSGLDCDSGELDEGALTADETVTMIAAKPGLFTFPGAAAVGRLSVANLDIPAGLGSLKAPTRTLVTARDVAGWLPERTPNSHKGTYGHVLIVGGSANYTGAPALAGRAAYRLGAGLVELGVASPLVDMLTGSFPEAIWLHLPHDLGALTEEGAEMIRSAAAQADSLVLGMGLGRDPATRTLIRRLFASDTSASRALIGFGTAANRAEPQAPAQFPALVLDADGLSLLAELPDWPAHLPQGTILTPHPGEMARLCDLPTTEVVQNRWELASNKAREWGVTLVLKGAHTLVAEPNGRLRVLPFKTSALATAGTGDVLAGMIGTLRAQGVHPGDAAAGAAWLHGLAGMIAAQQLGSERAVCASDVINALPAALAALDW